MEEKLDFGLNTYRIEHVHLKFLIRRIFDTLPIFAKSEVVKNFPPQANNAPWKILSLENIPECEVPVFYEIALENVSKMGSDEFTVNNLKVMVSKFSFGYITF